jgi:hypothetical protein
MTSSLELVDPAPWPSGASRPIGVVTLSPEDLERSYAIKFFEDYDNLDYYRAASVRLPSGRVVLLIRHRGSPTPGTVLEADSRDNPDSARAEFLAASGLPNSVFSWRP